MEKKVNKKRIDELVDDTLNIIGKNTDSSTTNDVKSKETTDQKVLRTRIRRNPFGGYGLGGSYGYFFGETEVLGNEDKKVINEKTKKVEEIKNKQQLKESVEEKTKKIVEDLFSKKSDEYDIEDKSEVKEIPSFESLQEHHPIVARQLGLLIKSIKERGVDTISDAIIINDIIDSIEISNIPHNLRIVLINKLKGISKSNVVSETKNK